MDLGLKGRVALVTGASRGLGYSVARELAAEGCDLHIAARDAARLDEVAAELRAAHGVAVTVHVVDLAERGAAERLAAAVGDIGVLVNNAGAIPRGNVLEIDGDAWRASWEVKVFGYIDLTRAILPGMMARGKGVIVNVVGVAGERADPNYVATCAGNAALIMFTNCVASQAAARNVRVVSVNPGPVMSDRFMSGVKRRAKQRFGDPDRWQEILDDYPMHRAGEPGEVSAAVAFLASDRASFIAGAGLRIDGAVGVADPYPLDTKKAR